MKVKTNGGEIEISKNDFERYEGVRSSGVTNMFAINTVERLSGLSKEKIIAIMNNYTILNTEFPGVRKH